MTERTLGITDQCGVTGWAKKNSLFLGQHQENIFGGDFFFSDFFSSLGNQPLLVKFYRPYKTSMSLIVFYYMCHISVNLFGKGYSTCIYYFQ